MAACPVPNNRPLWRLAVSALASLALALSLIPSVPAQAAEQAYLEVYADGALLGTLTEQDLLGMASQNSQELLYRTESCVAYVPSSSYVTYSSVALRYNIRCWQTAVNTGSGNDPNSSNVLPYGWDRNGYTYIGGEAKVPAVIALESCAVPLRDYEWDYVAAASAAKKTSPKKGLHAFSGITASMAQSDDCDYEFTLDCDGVSKVEFTGVVFDAQGDPAPSEGWEQVGSCEWQINSAKTLVIRPLQDGVSGTLPSSTRDTMPWCGSVDMTSIFVAPGVKAGESLNHAFANCGKLDAVDVSNLDTSSTTSLYAAFAGSGIRSISFTSASGAKWDTSKVKDARFAFEYALFDSIDLTSWDVSSLEDASCLFFHCPNLRTANLALWSSGALSRVSAMFYECESLNNIDLSSWSTPNLQDLSSMFIRNASLSDVTLFDMSSCTKIDDVSDMFSGCPALTRVPAGFSLPAASEASYRNVFYCPERTPILLPQGADAALAAYSWESDNRVVTEHVLTAVAATEPTTEAAGNRAYWSCSHCEKFFSDNCAQTEIEKDSWIIPKIDAGEGAISGGSPAAPTPPSDPIAPVLPSEPDTPKPSPDPESPANPGDPVISEAPLPGTSVAIESGAAAGANVIVITPASELNGRGAVAFKSPAGSMPKSVTVPKSVEIAGLTYSVVEIAPGAFKGNTRLKSVTLPSTIEKIGRGAFSGCTKLASVTLGQKVLSIGKSAFRGTAIKTLKIRSTKLTKRSIASCLAGSSISKVYVPKSKLAVYKKIFKKANCGRYVTLRPLADR